MTDEIYFNNLLQKVNGLRLILITDRDSVPILKVSKDDINFDLISFIPTFMNATDQAGKLGLGRSKTIISMYSNYQVIQINKLQSNLILTFVGTENCNTGHLLSLEHQLDKHLEDLKLAVCEA